MNIQEIQETEARIVGVLKSIFDPEIPVNIYDLGLSTRSGLMRNRLLI